MRTFFYDAKTNTLDTCEILPEGEYIATIKDVELNKPRLPKKALYLKIRLSVNCESKQVNIFHCISFSFLYPLQELCGVLGINYLDIHEREGNCAPQLLNQRVKIKLRHRLLPNEPGEKRNKIVEVEKYMELS